MELLDNDKGANVAIVSLKESKVSAYVISKRETDKRSNKEKESKVCFYRIKRSNKKHPGALIKEAIPITVESAEIAFENGIIKDVVLRAFIHKNNIPDSLVSFTNSAYIKIRNAEDIDLLSAKDQNFLSYSYGRDSILILDFADVINFNRKIPFTSGTYVIKDTTIFLSSAANSNKYVKLYKPAMSENFDVRIFTDVVGYNGKEPNGIAQAEAQLSFVLNQGKNNCNLYKVWKGNPCPLFKYRRQWVWIEKISPYFKFSKIEESNNLLQIDTVAGRGDFLDIFKYSHLNVGTELNIVTFRSDSKKFMFNIATGALRTTVGNNPVENKNQNLSTLYFNPNIDLKFFESNKIDFNIRLGAFGAWTINTLDSIKLADAMVKAKDYFFRVTNWWGQIEESINLHPNCNKQKSIFIRSTQYVSTKNNFFTFQIGYSTSLGSILKF